MSIVVCVCVFFCGGATYNTNNVYVYSIYIYIHMMCYIYIYKIYVNCDICV